MNLTIFLCCLLLVLTFNEIQRVQSEEVEIVAKFSQLSAEEHLKDVGIVKGKTGGSILKSIKLMRTKVKQPKVAKVPKLKSAPKTNRLWRPKMMTVGKAAAGIAATVGFQQGLTHLYDRFGFRYIPEAEPPTVEDQLQPAVMQYPQLAPFIVAPEYIHNPAMSYPYAPQPPAVYHPRQGYPSPGYQNPGSRRPGLQNQKLYLEKPTESNESDSESNESDSEEET